MKIETKFEIYDKVYYIDFEDKIREGQICQIIMHSNGELSYRIWYNADNLGNIENTEKTEAKLYYTIEEAIKAKMDIDKQNLEIKIQNLINDFVNIYQINNSFVKFENGKLSFKEMENEN